MRERFEDLSILQRLFLWATLGIVVVFSILYIRAATTRGFLYHGSILHRSTKCGTTIYSGRADGEDVYFLISEGHKLTFHRDGRVYGPYWIEDDPSAVPKHWETRFSPQGFVLYRGSEILYRGAYILENETLRLGSDAYADVGFSDLDSYETNADLKFPNLSYWEPEPPVLLTLIKGLESYEDHLEVPWFTFFRGVSFCLLAIVPVLFKGESKSLPWGVILKVWIYGVILLWISLP